MCPRSTSGSKRVTHNLHACCTSVQRSCARCAAPVVHDAIVSAPRQSIRRFKSIYQQEQIQALLDERKRIAEEGAGGAGGSNAWQPEDAESRRARPLAVAGVDGVDMVEIEAKRLEVTKRRQERELAQMVNYEVERKKMQVPWLG
jgi:hypothetical protein